MPKKKPRSPQEKPQHQRFKELARKVGAQKDNAAFDKAFKAAVPAKRGKPKA